MIILTFSVFHRPRSSLPSARTLAFARVAFLFPFPSFPFLTKSLISYPPFAIQFLSLFFPHSRPYLFPITLIASHVLRFRSPFPSFPPHITIFLYFPSPPHFLSWKGYLVWRACCRFYDRYDTIGDAILTCARKPT